MIKEAYVSFEVAKLLKEKGFNEKCRGAYHSEFDDNDNPIVMLEEWTAQPYNNDFEDETLLCSAPTHQMAMAWLREKNISIELSVVKPHYWVYTIYEILNNKVKELYNDGGFNSYEDAVEAALKYTFENLI